MCKIEIQSSTIKSTYCLTHKHISQDQNQLYILHQAFPKLCRLFHEIVMIFLHNFIISRKGESLFL